MIEVSNEAELKQALLTTDTDIVITQDISASSQINITHDVTITSNGTSVFKIFKTADFVSYLFRVTASATLVLTNIILDGVMAGRYTDNGANRSLVQVAGGNLRLSTGAILQNNSSYQEGGGVYLSGDPAYVNTFVMEDNAKIMGCESRTSGGGFMAAVRNVNDTAVIRGSASIDHNTASNGGGVYYRNYTVDSGSTLTVQDNVRIYENTANQSGGGIYVAGFTEGSSVGMKLQLNGNASVENNSAINGAGVYFYGISSRDGISSQGAVTVSDNTAGGLGGGIYASFLNGAANVDLTGVTCNGNIAKTGGGMYFSANHGGNIRLINGSINTNKSEAAGGGLWMQNKGTEEFSVTLSGYGFDGNNAAAQGGGCYINTGYGQFSLLSDTASFTDNTAGSYGGAIAFSCNGESSLRFEGNTLNANRAIGAGGGIYLANVGNVSSSVYILDGDFKNNSAGTQGGGIRFTSGNGALTTTLDSCNFSGNSAISNSGGAVWMGGNENTLTLLGGTSIVGNRTEEGNGGGIYFNCDKGELFLKAQTQIQHNSADTVSTSAGNHGGGISVIHGDVVIEPEVDISNNSALKFGGGISASENSHITMLGGAVYNNVSGGIGGGVYNHGGSVFNLLGGDVYGNSANTGGAFYNDSRLIYSGTGKIGGAAPNKASLYAPGVFNSGTFHAGGNGRLLSDGLYITELSAVAYITEPLSQSLIQIDNSNYVVPNAYGNPVVIARGTQEYTILSQTDADAFVKPPTDFDGWEIRLSDDQKQIVLAPEVYNIIYENLMGAHNPNVTTYVVTSADIVLQSPGAITGYRFIGWYDVNGNQITVIPSGSTGDVTLYAKWEALPLYTVEYYGNAPEGPEPQNIPAPLLVQQGQIVTVSQIVPSREGYIFKGWNTAADGTGTEYIPGGSLGPVNEDIKLYAMWQKQQQGCHYIRYNSNTKWCYPVFRIPSKQKVCNGDPITLSCCKPMRWRYNFIGWNTERDGSGESYAPCETIEALTENLYLYAQWECIKCENCSV